MRGGNLIYGRSTALRGPSRGRGGPVAAAVQAAPAAAPEAAPPRWDLLTVALGAMILTYVWRFQELYPILATIRLPIIASLTAYALYLANADPRRRLEGIKHPMLWLAIIILALVALSVPGSVWPGAALRFLYGTFVKTFLLMVVVAASVRSVVDVKRLAGIMVFGATIYSIYVLTRFEITADGRLSNLVYYDANDLALVVVCTFPLAVYFATRARGAFVRIAALLILALMVLAIVKSGSRGGFLGLIAVSVYLLFGFKTLSKQVRIGAVAGAFILLSFVASDRYWEMMESMLNPTEDYNWTAEDGRKEIWKRGIGYMLQNPVLGVGGGQFGVAEGTLSEHAGRQDLGFGFKWSTAHNSFVQIGAELGVIALAAFVALLIVAYRTARRGGRAPPHGVEHTGADAALGHALAGAVIGFAVAGFFLSQAYSIYLYTILGMVLGLAKVTGGSSPQEPAPTVQLPAGSVGRGGMRAPVGRGGLATHGAYPGR